MVLRLAETLNSLACACRLFIDKLADEDTGDDWIESLALKDALAKLGERELDIIKKRFYKGRTQMEIAEEIGISQAQVSRLEKGAIDKLRRYMS